MSSAKRLARLLSKEKEHPQKEIDPEDQIRDDDDSVGDSDSDFGDKDDLETEHYVSVGKSKLRQDQTASLGPAYRGVSVSRKQLEQESESEEGDDDSDDDDDDDSEDDEEEFADPDEVDITGAEEVNDSEDEIDSDDALGPDDDKLLKKFVFRGSSKPRDTLDEDDDEEEEDDDEDSEEDDEEEEDSIALPVRSKEEKRKELADGRKQVLAPLSQAAKEEVDKGLAIRQQRRTFDEILKMRLRLQKALSSANSLHVAQEGDGEESAAITVATSKAIELLTALQNIRQSFYLQDATDKKKRKRSTKTEADADRSCQGIYNEMASAEKTAVTKRRKVLDQWSSRAQTKVLPSEKSASSASGVTEALDARLEKAAVDRFVKRSQTPRKCAPVQLARRVTADPEIYDDTDFYEVLLRELVDQRSSDTFAPGNSATTVRWAASAARGARTRKEVDRQASKGRKMRYNEHEKLENFSTPEDRREWEREPTAWLFGTLFGQRMGLQGDDNEAEDDDQEDDDVDLEENGLRQFRS